jgi:hypothetical protein
MGEIVLDQMQRRSFCLPRSVLLRWHCSAQMENRDAPGFLLDSHGSDDPVQVPCRHA